MDRRSFLATTAAGAAALSFPAILRAQSKDPLRIGCPLPLTGPFAALAADMQRGAQLAEEQLNAAGGVMGRKVEETMLHVVAGWAREAGLDELYAEYKPTAKNRPCLEFFKKSGLEPRGEHVFAWALRQEYPASPEIQLVDGVGACSMEGHSAASDNADPSR